jgi:hypothetical protein
MMQNLRVPFLVLLEILLSYESFDFSVLQSVYILSIGPE